MPQLYAGYLEIICNDRFCLLVRIYDLRQRFHMSGFQPLALINVEYVVVAEEGNLLLFASLFVFLFEPFSENDHAALFALPDVAARLLNLLEGCIFTGTT